MKGKCWGPRGNCTWCDVEIRGGCNLGLPVDNTAVCEHEGSSGGGRLDADHKILPPGPHVDDVERGRTYDPGRSGQMVDAVTSFCPDFDWNGLLLLSRKGHAVHVRRRGKRVHVRRTRVVSISDD